MQETLRQAAFGLAARGCAILPCLPRQKIPATLNGVKDATADLATIIEWWTTDENFNIGIATGSASGFFVVDVDGENGEQTIRDLESEHGPLPESVEAITGKGRHIYFRLPEGDPVRNSVGRIGPGVDVRGENGYVLAPCSTHPSGRRYEWSVDSGGGFADAPNWLLEKLAEPSEGCATPPEEWRALLSGAIGEGQRNDRLTRLAGYLLRHRVDPYVALSLIQSINRTHCAPPLPDNEVTATVNSIARREAQRRNGHHG